MIVAGCYPVKPSSLPGPLGGGTNLGRAAAWCGFSLHRTWSAPPDVWHTSPESGAARAPEDEPLHWLGASVVGALDVLFSNAGVNRAVVTDAPKLEAAGRHVDTEEHRGADGQGREPPLRDMSIQVASTYLESG
jgi:hypothetical protein